MSTCGGLQKASRPIDRCHAMSQCAPSATDSDAANTHATAHERVRDLAPAAAGAVVGGAAARGAEDIGGFESSRAPRIVEALHGSQRSVVPVATSRVLRSFRVVNRVRKSAYPFGSQ